MAEDLQPASFHADIAYRTNTYTYVTLLRLASAAGVTLTWESNGNLLTDGTSTHTLQRLPDSGNLQLSESIHTTESRPEWDLADPH